LDASAASVASLIKSRRAQLGLSQQAFALLIGVSQPEVARWESGRIRKIDDRNKERLAEVGVSRVALGLTSFSFDEIEVDIEVAFDETFMLAKPLLAMSIIAPELEWLHRRWIFNMENNTKVGQEEVSLFARALLLKGLIVSLVFENSQRSKIFETLEMAEYVAHHLRDEEQKDDIVSHALLITGNELRKIEEHEHAEHVLEQAFQIASRAQLFQRSAELAGLTCYVSAGQGHSEQANTYLRNAENALAMVRESETYPNVAHFGISVFDELSLEEVKLRSCLLLGDRPRVHQLTRRAQIPLTNNYHWEMYYSNTLAAACAYIGNPDGIHWLGRASRIAERVSSSGQLIRIMRTSSKYDSPSARQIGDRAKRQLADLDGDSD
jgi:transcriptional regulator with XRE-family HTH domain